MSEPLPKRYGKKLPLVIDNGERICFSVTIPDQLEYRSALMGQLNDMGFWFSWDHTQAEVYEPHERQTEAAQLWLNTIADAAFEVCMTFCEQMINCVTSDTDVQRALANQLLSDPDFLKQMQQNILQGNKLSPTEITTPIGENCERDQLWAGCLGMIQQMNRNNVDFLELVEVGTNIIERVTDAIRAIPVFETLPFDDIINFVNTLFEDITENYNSEYNTEYENVISCELFCLALESPTCEMSFDDIYNIFRNRLSASFTIESALQDVIQFLATGTWSGTQVCDFMFMLQLQCIRSASKFLGINLLSLQTMFNVGVDNPNSSWRELCIDCPEPTPDCYAFSIDEQGWVITENAHYVPSTGFQASTSAPWSIQNGDHSKLCNTVKITFNNDWFDGTNDFHKFFVVISSYGGGNSQGFGTGAGPLLQGQTITLTSTSGNWEGLNIYIAAGGYTWPNSVFIIEVCCTIV